MAETKKKDPFKTKKTSSTKKGTPEVDAPGEVTAAVDSYKQCYKQMKSLEGEATIYKDEILRFVRDEFAARMINGQPGSFKVAGEEESVTFIIQNSSSSISDEEYENFVKEWGEEKADALIRRDFKSIRFNPTVLEANYDAVVEALQTLPDDVLENLFQPMSMTVVPDVLLKIKEVANSPEEFLTIFKSLKVKNYIK